MRASSFIVMQFCAKWIFVSSKLNEKAATSPFLFHPRFYVQPPGNFLLVCLMRKAWTLQPSCVISVRRY